MAHLQLDVGRARDDSCEEDAVLHVGGIPDGLDVVFAFAADLVPLQMRLGMQQELNSGISIGG